MASKQEDFEELDIRPSLNAEGKKVFLVRLPRTFDAGTLDGALLKGGEHKPGTLIGRLADDDTGRRLKVVTGDPNECTSIRPVIYDTTDKALKLGPGFHGLLVLSEDFLSAAHEAIDAAPAPETPKIFEAYQGAPQLTGMQVRFRPAGAGLPGPAPRRRGYPGAGAGSGGGGGGGGSGGSGGGVGSGSGGSGGSGGARNREAAAAAAAAAAAPAVGSLPAKRKREEPAAGDAGATPSPGPKKSRKSAKKDKKHAH